MFCGAREYIFQFIFYTAIQCATKKERMNLTKFENKTLPRKFAAGELAGTKTKIMLSE